MSSKDSSKEEPMIKTYKKVVLEAPTAPKERVEPPQMITFDRYFIALGKPMHHKAGMAAFVNSKGKKTQEAWHALFENY